MQLIVYNKYLKIIPKRNFCHIYRSKPTKQKSLESDFLMLYIYPSYKLNVDINVLF